MAFDTTKLWKAGVNEYSIDDVGPRATGGTHVELTQEEKEAKVVEWNAYGAKQAGKILERVRLKRNDLLSQCDWTVAADSQLSVSKQNEWKTYRQELRDITATVSSEEDRHILLDIHDSSLVFPTKPS